jgi:RNA polymerase sigma factor (sigma-70 family)
MSESESPVSVFAAAARLIADVRSALGERAVRLAYHAAVPVVVDAELLNLLRVNFFLDPPSDLPYEAEAALLLSPLFREVGDGLYEIEPGIRSLLLSGLRATYTDERLQRVAALLGQYTDASVAWRALPELEMAQRLTAVNFLDPSAAREWLDGVKSGAAPGVGLDREWYVAMDRRIDEQAVLPPVDVLRQAELAGYWATFSSRAAQLRETLEKRKFKYVRATELLHWLVHSTHAVGRALTLVMEMSAAGTGTAFDGDRDDDWSFLARIALDLHRQDGRTRLITEADRDVGIPAQRRMEITGASGQGLHISLEEVADLLTDFTAARTAIRQASATENSGAAVDMVGALSQQSARGTADGVANLDAIRGILSRLDPTRPVEERLALIRDLGALALPGGSTSHVVIGLCRFIEAWDELSFNPSKRVTADIQAALTTIGTLPNVDIYLRGVVLTGARLVRLNFRNAHFVGVTLADVDAREIDLTSAIFEDVELSDVVLDGARLDGADLRFRSLRQVSLLDVSVQDTVMRADIVEDVTATVSHGVPMEFSEYVLPNVREGALAGLSGKSRPGNAPGGSSSGDIAPPIRSRQPSGKPATNDQLIAAAVAGDQKAWDTLVDRYTGLLWNVTRQYRLSTADASDVVQSTWLRLLENLHRFTDAERLPGWLMTTARREALHVLRRADYPRPSGDFSTIPDEGPAPGEQLLNDEFDVILREALARLGEPCERLLRLLISDPPPSYAEVAAMLDMKVGSIGPTRQRCLGRLRQLVEHNPGLVGARHARAKELAQRGDRLRTEGHYAQARASYEAAIGFDANLSSAQIGFGMALLGTGQYTQARDAFREALRLDPGNASARRGLGEATQRAGLFPTAIGQVLDEVGSIIGTCFQVAPGVLVAAAQGVSDHHQMTVRAASSGVTKVSKARVLAVDAAHDIAVLEHFDVPLPTEVAGTSPMSSWLPLFAPMGTTMGGENVELPHCEGRDGAPALEVGEWAGEEEPYKNGTMGVIRADWMPDEDASVIGVPVIRMRDRAIVGMLVDYRPDDEGSEFLLIRAEDIVTLLDGLADVALES